MAISSNHGGSIVGYEWQSVAIMAVPTFTGSMAINGNQRQSEAISSNQAVPASQLELMCVQMIEEAWEAAEDCIIGEL